MLKETTDHTSTSTDVITSDQTRVLVIGSGPVGIRFAEELSKKSNYFIHLFDQDENGPYNRVQLSNLLAGNINRDEILYQYKQPEGKDFVLSCTRIVSIDREEKYIVDSEGKQYPYDYLVIATGSSPHVPNILGTDKRGVFTFRSLKDAESLYARTLSSRKVIVIGGGLLGIEAAKGLRRYNNEVTIVQQGSHLMNKQLDAEASQLLGQELERLGITYHTHSGVRYITGFNKVTGVVTRDEKNLECDTVVFCAGIKPNIELARNAGIRVGQGIIVNNNMQTSDPDILAIGECCQHNGIVFGIVNPGFEQAAVASTFLSDPKQQDISYKGSLNVCRLKVLGISIYSAGDAADPQIKPKQSIISYNDNDAGIYRKIVLHKGKLIAALSVGEWKNIERVHESLTAKRKFSIFQTLLFKFTGRLWLQDHSASIASWPNNRLICQCNSVTKGEITKAIKQGATSLAAIAETTKASTTCGSCTNLISQLTDNDDVPTKSSDSKLLTLTAIISIVILAVFLLLPESQVSASVQTQTFYEKIWNDKFYKQVTGFTLLGLTCIGLLMSLRKRLNIKWMGAFSYWRGLHAVLGITCLMILFLHTGLHMGSNLNNLLLVNFLAILGLGSITSLTIGINHKLQASTAAKYRKLTQWSHILISWPLPVLLFLHIFSVYFF